jgi:hypothetical protein
MDPYLWGALLTVLVCAIAAAVVVVQARWSSSERRARYNEVNGFVFAIVGVLYAVVIAFVVMDVWDKISTAREQTYQESTALVELYWHAQYLPPAEGDAVRSLTRQYTTSVVEKDWPVMREGRMPDPNGWATLNRIRTTLESASSVEGAANEQAQAATAELQHVYEARQARLSTVDAGVPAVMWLVLLAGGLLSIVLTFMFGVPGRLGPVIIVVSFTAMVTMLLCTVYALQRPFDGAGGLTPEAFRLALARFTQIG